MILPNTTCSNVSQPTSSYKDAYNKPFRQMKEDLKFDNGQVAMMKGLVTLLVAEDPPERISSSNLIVECGEFSCSISSFIVEGTEFVGVVTQRRKLQFDYALFERKYKSFEFAGHNSVEALSGQTMETIWDAARSYIESLPKHRTSTGHRIQVYEV